MLALVVDWFASTLVVLLLIGPSGWSDDRYSGFYTMAVYVIESALLTASVGGSFGKLLTRLRVVRHDSSGAPVGLLQALLRSVLICLVIPPLVFRPDGRGLHDIAAGTATVTLQTASGSSR
ncbi:MAG: RDD family protein [Nocardioides sp.]|nr:RDD family protein [Nocardioides sp.]